MENKQYQLWEQVKQLYKDKFGIEPTLVDVMADINILRLCATGASNRTIARFLDLPEEDEVYQPIANTIDKYFGFRGWEFDMSHNPLRLCRDGLWQQVSELEVRICEIYLALERLLDEKWI